MNADQRKIYHYLTRLIADGKLLKDDRLPTEMELARQFDTNRMNAHNAVKRIEEEGLVRRNKKQGTLVNPDVSLPAASELKNYSADRAHVIASLEKSTFIHWDETTLVDLETCLAENGRKLYYESLPDKPTKKDLRHMIATIGQAGSSAIVFLPDQGETQFLMRNIDVLVGFRGDIYLLERGTGLTDEWPFHRVCLDPFSEGVQAARFLCESGHRRIHFAKPVSTRPRRSSYWLNKREKGLRFELRSLTRGKGEIVELRCPDEGYGEHVCEAIENTDEKPVIVAPTDGRAAMIMMAAEAKGLKSPRDFQLLSFDNDDRYRRFKLTSVAPPKHKIGSLLGRLICEKNKLLDGGEKISIRLSSVITQGKTCFKLRG